MLSTIASLTAANTGPGMLTCASPGESGSDDEMTPLQWCEEVTNEPAAT
jgi:hypothetical protein